MRRVFRLGLRRSLASDVDDELAFHIEMRTRKLMAEGLSESDARREALRQFGDMNSIRENCLTMDQQRARAERRANVFADLRQDFAFALRTLGRNVAFTALVVLTLAIGIGANTAIFTLIDAVLLRTLP